MDFWFLMYYINVYGKLQHFCQVFIIKILKAQVSKLFTYFGSLRNKPINVYMERHVTM